MVKTVNLYMDESGTRHPAKKPGRGAAHKHDWFAFGGILVKSEDESSARTMHSTFCNKWKITYPLHSSEIRGRNNNFLWLRTLASPEIDRFYEELYMLLRDAPVVGLACVVDRAGYNNRYEERYKQDRWSLCKTAFNISVERAAKYAISLDRKLSVYTEKCNKMEDKLAMGYIKSLKTVGLPFNPGTSGKYSPLSSANFSETLYDFKTKAKSSPMAQFADLYLWPICMGGYDEMNRPYSRLLADGKLIECHLPPDSVATCGTKYSCFELRQEG